MYRRLATLTAKTGLAAGIVLLLTLGTLMPGAPRASADDCPEGTAPLSAVAEDPQCVALLEEDTAPEPTPPPSSAPAPTPTELPPPTQESGTVPPEEPVPSAVPESSPAVVTPPPATAPAPSAAPPSDPQTPATTPAPAPATAPAEVTQTPDEPAGTATPAPAIVPPEPPANADNSGVIVPGDGPRLLWAVAAGASASGLLAAIVAFYLVSVRPVLLDRRRPGALG